MNVKTDFRPTAWHEGMRKFGLKMFTREGMAAAAAYSMTSAFLSAFALSLGADSVYIGLLSAVPMILWTIALLPSALLCERYIQKRKWIVVVAATAARLMWVPIILIALWFASSSMALGMLLLVVTISTAIGAISTPAWASIAGDIVPENFRGRYFSKRTVATTAAGLLSSLAAGWMLDVFGRHDTFGFAVIFSIGMAFSLMSSLFFSRIPSPPTGFSKEFHTSFIADTWHDRRFRTFLLLFAVWQFGIMFTSPFLNVFLLKTLQAEYIWISIFTVVGGIAGILVQRGWGLFSDRYGHRVVMIIAAFGTVPAILLWAPATDPLILIPIEIFSGMVWAGFTLAYYNYMLELSPSKARPIFVAMFSVVVGITSIVGPIAGGLAAEYFATNALFGFLEYRAVFLIGGAVRLVAAVLFMLFLAEVVEKRERVKPGYVFGEMIRSGVQGGIFRAHHTAGGVTKDVSFVEEELRKAAKIVGKDVGIIARAVDAVVERMTEKADKAGDRIAENGIAWPSKKGEVKFAKSDDGKKLKVRVEE